MDAKTRAFLDKMEKKFGKNVLRPASSIKEEFTRRCSTGSVTLDIATAGGYPVGRFIQVSGAFSSTKSTTVYHGIKNFQKMTKTVGDKKIPLKVLLIQGENGSWTDEYGRSIGIDTDELMVNECASMEEALEVAIQCQLNEIADVIVFDSFAALVPMKEADSSMEDSVQMGIKPKLFDEYFRKWQATNNKLSREGKHPVTVIGINQLREKIGSYGDPEYTPGGRSIGFTASMDIRLRRGDWITIGTGQNKEIIGQQVKFKIHKSKVSIPQKTGMWETYIDEGGPVPKGHIDNFKEVVLESVAYGVVDKAGAWMSYKDIKVQGADKLVETLRDRPELFEEIKAATMDVALAEHEAELKEYVPEEILEEIAEEEEIPEKPKPKSKLKKAVKKK